ncbi:TIGR03619 family F420-dependent LLM class oxidoreductase [Planosporangium flavigriseum]|uniref:LLM class F420-dependent oxidoreductase n=1 Tax=Planosporangium flavigriseum TaxID=373681 RepID=A0A8J3LQ31_9ACTN|nr:TIGR03619 family F420-dependent LLM class oxidoreductase [Planosporangium flavigriseum]NJC65958.1 TIGR03619 family F420-dependent LLM class oxidoreductase [Planosporangium flavigriseum]GIG74578.1 LLM class F420-dependent oxidoreductase [Planosporangium flavigriseum]
MRIGFGLPVSGAWATPDNIARFAAQAEQLGYDSLWTFQRLLVGADQELAPVYQSVLDPLVSLAYAAAHTTRIRLGVAVVNFPFVSPAYLAKQAASLDVLSGGRHDLGLGAGWSPAEFIATGAKMERRGARAEEYLKVLRTLWADEVSQFDGEFYTIPPSRMAPKPIQRPGPPVLLGGAAKSALRRAGRAADGWVSGSAMDLTQIAESVAVIHGAAREAGRDPESLRIVSRGVVRVGEPTGGGERQPLSGSYEQIRADTRRLGEAGVTEVFYDLNWDPLIGSPDADPTSATRRADEMMRALAPAV